MLDDLAARVHENSRAKGFWDHDRIALPEDPSEPRYAPARSIANPSIDAEKLALIHSEVSEALEAHRDGDMAHVEEELADVIIRVLDLAAARGMSMDRAVEAKIAVNATRPPGHGRVW